MFYTHHQSFTDCQLISLLDEMSATCDRDFDEVYDDLEREFATRRLQLGNEQEA